MARPKPKKQRVNKYKQLYILKCKEAIKLEDQIDRLKIDLDRAEKVWNELSAAVGVSSPTGFAEVDQVRLLQEKISRLERQHLDDKHQLFGRRYAIPKEVLQAQLDVVGQQNAQKGRINTTKYTREFRG